MKCIICGNKVPENFILKDFCSDDCYKFSEVVEDGLIPKIKKLARKKEQPYLWEYVIKRMGFFYISHTTLDMIKNEKKFSDTIEEKNLMIVRLSEEMSVIKKSII